LSDNTAFIHQKLHGADETVLTDPLRVQQPTAIVPPLPTIRTPCLRLYYHINHKYTIKIKVEKLPKAGWCYVH